MQTISIQRGQMLSFYARKGTCLYVSRGRLSLWKKPFDQDGYSITSSLMLMEEENHTMSNSTWVHLNAHSDSIVLLEENRSLFSRLGQENGILSTNALTLIALRLYRVSRRILS